MKNEFLITLHKALYSFHAELDPSRAARALNHLDVDHESIETEGLGSVNGFFRKCIVTEQALSLLSAGRDRSNRPRRISSDETFIPAPVAVFKEQVNNLSRRV